MATKQADARPRKSFFLDMFTRDISLEDCVLDLIDNSIDAYIRTNNIHVTSDYLLAPDLRREQRLGSISVVYSEDRFSISDNCGGIDIEHARREVFTFGHTAQDQKGTLGVYGIGLKRALFKLGNHFVMNSQTTAGGFSVELTDVAAWAAKDNKLEDWTVPLTPYPARRSKGPGTKIVITDLRPEVKAVIRDGFLDGHLNDFISQTYGYFLERLVRVTVNGNMIPPRRVLFGSSTEAQAGNEHIEQAGVSVDLFTGLAQRNSMQEWRAEDAGWYVLCNGRVIVNADKTELTGWGVGAPIFVSKYIGFLGVVMFYSQDPLLLPWTTTKRALNKESLIYQSARRRMRIIARPVLSFLNSMYKAEVPESLPERDIANRVQPTEISQLSRLQPGLFRVEVPKRATKKTRRVQYDAKIRDLERVQRRLRRPDLAANKIGEITFQYYLDKECPE